MPAIEKGTDAGAPGIVRGLALSLLLGTGLGLNIAWWLGQALYLRDDTSMDLKTYESLPLERVRVPTGIVQLETSRVGSERLREFFLAQYHLAPLVVHLDRKVNCAPRVLVLRPCGLNLWASRQRLWVGRPASLALYSR